ncbi:MAG: molybdopterin-dependent oxidoreductase [Pseudomonadota bacterium]
MTQQTRSTCPYCGVGCGVIIESQGEQITGVRGDPEHPANFGRLCTKGSTLHLTASRPVTLQTRLLQPMRRATRGAAPQAIGWDTALDEAATRLAHIVERDGPDAIGLYISGQLLTEDYYVFNKLAKGLIGTNNIDTNSRLCMSSAVAGYKATLGADAPPACYDDLNHAGTVFIVGANTAYAHPILFRRLEDARRANPALRLIVADPRRTETAEVADLHLPILPGSDVALFHGLLHLLLAEGRVDEAYIAAHTEGFEPLRRLVADYTPDRVARLCGIAAEDLIQAARWFGGHTPTLSLYCQGLNQSSRGTDKNAALINLHLATGQIGKPGAGPFSLTGQPNAMGGREVGGMANLLSAHRDLGNAQHRAEVAALWGVREVPAAPGKTAVEMFQAAADGQIKALWIACTNPAQSLPDQATVRRALERAEFVIVQESFATASTCAHADLLLPATTWGEKVGTVTNSERRISRVRPAVPPPGQARHDWAIVVDVAQRLQARWRERLAAHAPGRQTLFPYPDAEAIWNEHRESTRGRDLDITGLSWAMLDAAGPQQWPLPQGATAGRARLYEDGRFPTPTGRARFAAVPWEPVAEPCDEAYPFALTTGRLRDHWHGLTRTGNLGRLYGHVAEPLIDLHPQDLARLGVADGDLVEVRSRRGALVLPARAQDGVAPGQAFLPMHWGQEALSGRDDAGQPLAGINALTSPAVCPTSRQPELKHTAVALRRIELPAQVFAMAWLPHERALAVREALRELMSSFRYAACVPFGREPHERGLLGVMFRGASERPVGPELLARLAALLGLDDGPVMRFEDHAAGQLRLVQLARPDRSPPQGAAGAAPAIEAPPSSGDDLRLRAVLLAGDTRSQAWLRPLMVEELPVQRYGRLLLAPGSQAPVPMQARGPQVCTCFNVSQPEIEAVLARCGGSADQRLAQLQGELKCGTNCGSCIPTLKKLVREGLKAA